MNWGKKQGWDVSRKLSANTLSHVQIGREKAGSLPTEVQGFVLVLRAHSFTFEWLFISGGEGP